MNNLKSVTIGKFRVDSYESNGTPIACLFELRPKARRQKEMRRWGYAFQTVEARDERFTKEVASLKLEEAKKASAREEKKNMVNPFSLGEIFYDSWGYGQTNIDWYQVTKVNPKSVIVRRLEADVKSKSMDLHGSTTPIRDSFKGTREILKKVNVASWEEKGSEDRFYLKSEYGWMSKWNGEPKGSSWGN